MAAVTAVTAAERQGRPPTMLSQKASDTLCDTVTAPTKEPPTIEGRGLRRQGMEAGLLAGGHGSGVGPGRGADAAVDEASGDQEGEQESGHGCLCGWCPGLGGVRVALQVSDGLAVPCRAIGGIPCEGGEVGAVLSREARSPVEGFTARPSTPAGETGHLSAGVGGA